MRFEVKSMAITLYGYKIVMGKAVIDPEALEKINTFYDRYLAGLSVKEAQKTAELPLSHSGVINMMKNEDYLGTDYYPPLITAEVFYAAQKEHEKRTHKGTSLPAQPVPVKSAFILAPLPDKTEQRRAAETVALLYSMITPSESGKATATGAETAAIKAWAEKRITSIPPKSTGDDERSTKCQ